MQHLFNLKEIRQRFPALCEKRSAHAHKGILGTVGVVGSSTGMTGAVALASVAALKTGCGKVFAGFHQNARESHQTKAPTGLCYGLSSVLRNDGYS